MTLTYGEMRSRTEKINDAIIKRRVQAGLLELEDRYGDDWVEKIDCKRLNLASSSQCVLGQVCGDFDEGVVMVHGEWDSGWAEDHGFLIRDPGDVDIDDAYVDLTVAWKTVLCDMP